MKFKDLSRQVFGGIVIAVFLVGCATVGKPFDYKGPSSIAIGKTTKQEVLTMFGNPFRTGYEDDKLKWTYGFYHYRVFGDSDTKDLAITFNQNGVVSSYTYSSTNPDEIKKSIEN